MKNMKYGTGLLAYVLGIAVFFAIGFGAGRINGRNEMQEKLKDAEEERSVSASISTKEEITEYEMKLNNNKLCLYELRAEGRELIAESEISEEIYPPSDVKELKEGIVFDNKLDALEMFENFVS